MWGAVAYACMHQDNQCTSKPGLRARLLGQACLNVAGLFFLRLHRSLSTNTEYSCLCTNSVQCPLHNDRLVVMVCWHLTGYPASVQVSRQLQMNPCTILPPVIFSTAPPFGGVHFLGNLGPASISDGLHPHQSQATIQLTNQPANPPNNREKATIQQ